MPTSNTEELGRFLKCTVIGRGVFGPCACCTCNLDFALREFLQLRHLKIRSKEYPSRRQFAPCLIKCFWCQKSATLVQ